MSRFNPRMVFMCFVISLAVQFVGNLLIRILLESETIGRSSSVVIAIASALPLCLVAVMFPRIIRQLDELQQRIALQGLALAMAVWISLSAVYVNLAVTGISLFTLDPHDLIMIPALLIALCILIASLRYK